MPNTVKRDNKLLDMDDESTRQHLQIDIPINSVSSTSRERRLISLVILMLLCIVMACGVTFAVVVLERGAEVESKVNSHETQLQMLKKLTGEILQINSNNSATSRAMIPKSATRKHAVRFGYTSKKVKNYIFSASP